MTKPGSGVAWGNWLVSKTSGLLDAKLGRRSFIARATLLGSAVAASGCAVITQPGSPYQRVTDCPGGLCTDGYTEFCCVINNGQNNCPSGTIPAGWWRADGSIYCGGGPRYYIDCNEVCCGPSLGNGFCAGCSPCRCAVDCNTRRVHCNYFRYGQCNPQVGAIGPIACRLVICTAPYTFPPLNCTASDAVDDNTANHTANCPTPSPSTPPPPPPPAAAVSTGGAAAVATGQVVLLVRGGSGDVLERESSSGSWPGWYQSIGGYVTSRVVAVSPSAGTVRAFARGGDNRLYDQTFDGSSWGGWQTTFTGVTLNCDPAVAVSGSTIWVVIRDANKTLQVNHGSGTSFSGWSAIPATTGATSDPAVAVAGSKVFTFWRGADNGLWTSSSTDGTTWTGAASLGGNLSSDICAVPFGAGLAVATRFSNNEVAIYHYDGTNWSAEGLADASALSDPVLVNHPSGLFLFWVGLDGNLYSKTYNGSSWTGATFVTGDGHVLSDPQAVVDGSNIYLFWAGPGGAVWTATYSGGTWGSFTYLGSVASSVRGGT